MAGRILGVRVGTYVSLAYYLSLSLSFSVFYSFSRRPPLPSPLLLFFLFGESAFFLHLDRLDDSFLPRVSSSLSPGSLHAPLAGSSSSSRLAAFGYHLGHRGHPPRCTRYVVCPIFTHGKITLKRRWTPVRFSFPSSLPSTIKPRSSSISYHGCFSISADRVKIGSQRFACEEDPLLGGSEKSLFLIDTYTSIFILCFPFFLALLHFTKMKSVLLFHRNVRKSFKFFILLLTSCFLNRKIL